MSPASSGTETMPRYRSWPSVYNSSSQRNHHRSSPQPNRCVIPYQPERVLWPNGQGAGLRNRRLQ
eukprot:22982-Pelagococcus_subviridis.AAC.1